MYWQQKKLLPQFFTPEIELLGEKEYIYIYIYIYIYTNIYAEYVYVYL